MTMLRPLLLLPLLFSIYLSPAFADSTEDAFVAYCTESGGTLEFMQAEFFVGHGKVQGFTKPFCRFHVNNGTISIGLETFSSESPNIAATYAKTLGTIDENSKLWEGTAGNPSLNVCKNLGGTSIGVFSMGAFTSSQGQSDICVFGDGSMISGWSLIYMANHRTGYDDIKERIRAEPIRK